MRTKEIQQYIKELEEENKTLNSYSTKHIFNEGKIELLESLLRGEITINFNLIISNRLD